MTIEAKQIIEGNKLIIESHFASDIHKSWLITLDKFEGKRDAAYENSKYHSSWNWLMPVVKNIFDTDTGTLDVYSLYVSDSLKYAEINRVWEAVIDYIQWHNTINTNIKTNQ